MKFLKNPIILNLLKLRNNNNPSESWGFFVLTDIFI